LYAAMAVLPSALSIANWACFGFRPLGSVVSLLGKVKSFGYPIGPGLFVPTVLHCTSYRSCCQVLSSALVVFVVYVVLE